MAQRPRSLSMTDALRMVPNIFHAARNNHGLAASLAKAEETRAQMEGFIAKLPKLSEKDLNTLNQSDSSCPVCLTSFLALLAEEEMASVMDSPAHAAEDLGVTRLVSTCGHVFCRKELRDRLVDIVSATDMFTLLCYSIRNWLQQGRNSCPTCRRPLIPTLPTLPDTLLDDIDIEEQILRASEGMVQMTDEQASAWSAAVMLLAQGDSASELALPLQYGEMDRSSHLGRPPARATESYNAMFS